ncbi:hypothetical protein EST38_g3178 [Candolleomyces aberdarensis]|uniref:Uncharacterized protein n=1 Tax=Candolleomyces aberdarensis TaxID=2316362 RepID=A0A4Q2DTQ2_9AGAR|nr:hypothetical protein EST38_g3178 [Candolleomyces aberdarensis]
MSLEVKPLIIMSSDVLPARKRVDEHPPHWTESFFIILSAKALSSLGFGLVRNPSYPPADPI